MASGDTLCVFTPLANEPPAAAYATLDAIDVRPVLDFDTTTDEEAVFTGIMPRNYAGGGITVNIHWCGDTDHNAATYVCWNVAIERIEAAHDTAADAFTAFNFVKNHPNDTVRYMVVSAVTFTDGADMDSVAVGNYFRIKIRRDADGTNDTDDMPGDASLFAVEIKET
jgi:hypothetical protein